MIIYYEYLFLLNLMIHYLTIKITERITLNFSSKKRFFLSSVILVSYLYLDTKLYLKYFSLFFGIVLGYISFKNNKINNIFFYYFINIFLGGITGILKQYFNNYMYISIVILIIIFEIISYLLNKKTKNKFKYEMLVKNGEKVIKYIGFLDTGLDALDSNGTPVIIINDYAYGKFKEVIKVNTVKSEEDLYLYSVDKVSIKVNEKWKEINCVIAYKSIDYQALLNVNFIRWG